MGKQQDKTEGEEILCTKSQKLEIAQVFKCQKVTAWLGTVAIGVRIEWSHCHSRGNGARSVYSVRKRKKFLFGREKMMCKKNG